MLTLIPTTYAVPPKDEFRACKQNEDCVIVDATHCGCAIASAQNQYAVNKKYELKIKSQYEADLEKTYSGCPLGVSEKYIKKCANLKAVCEKSLCQIK